MRWWESGWEVGSDMMSEWNPGLPTIIVSMIILIGGACFILYQLSCIFRMVFGV